MLRYVIPVVAGCCCYGAERLVAASPDQDRPAQAETRYAEPDCEAPRPRFVRVERCEPREERCEPARGRAWHVDIDIRRDDRRDRDDRGRCEPAPPHGRR